jgi:hypothetical protein
MRAFRLAPVAAVALAAVVAGCASSDHELHAKGAAALAATTKPKIVSARTSGDNAVVNLHVIRRDKVGQVVQEKTLGKLRLDLVRGPSGWLINWQSALPRLPAALG